MRHGQNDEHEEQYGYNSFGHFGQLLLLIL